MLRTGLRQNGSYMKRIRWVLVAVMLLVFVGDRMLNGRRGENHHQQLRTEFSQIRPLPNASLVGATDNFSPWNSHKALVGAKYATSIPFTEIQAFYSRELDLRGWRIADDRALTDWGKDLGGRAITYCKGELAASLEYVGAKPHYTWTYALDLSWGLHTCN
jgi:hypothetical protein